jgi:hypothetical protein
VRIWDRALSGPEVASLYAGGVPPNGVVAEYLLDSDVAFDSSGGHNGTIIGGTWVQA